MENAGFIGRSLFASTIIFQTMVMICRSGDTPTYAKLPNVSRSQETSTYGYFAETYFMIIPGGRNAAS